ncbi:hypothetical protein EW145_g2214 [Phellinidium pouzarii]|uniref:Xylanolytic transcriptional activator regulatory domain-containing protein n=1 Tax=Phellinidium pouzarii TaxID=167371 RepID=A0A4S4LC97_9AGAM|nr:hypothetical protein EW145_g2214 [Phellinidium pouzarii]
MGAWSLTSFLVKRSTHEELLLKSHKQDLEIVNLLRQFDELTTDKRVQSWVDKVSTKHSSSSPTSRNSLSSSHSSTMERDRTSWTSSYGYGELGSPCDQAVDMNVNYLPSPTSQFPCSSKDRFSVQELLAYFPDSTVTSYTKPPELIARGLIHPGDIRELFILYFRFINPYFSILDPVLHTPERLFWHSHFLFSLICCVATKYSQKYSPMIPLFIEFARDLGGKALVQGRKTIDECQAFLIHSVYQTPRKRFEDQRGWLTMGLAFSLANELQLNKPSPADYFALSQSVENMDTKDALFYEMAARDRLNRIRTWLNCYCVDASHATQFGKPAMLDVEDYVARNCREWYHSSPFNLAIDVHLVSYVEVSRVMRHFRIEVEELEIEEKESPKRPKKVKEVLEIVERYHCKLHELYTEWSNRINAFNRLVVLFYGLQHVVAAKKGEEGAGASRDDKLVRQCIEAAKEVIKGMIYKLYPTGMLRYSMEAHFLFATFAAAHLLSLLRPEMSVLLHSGDLEEIDYLVRELVKVLRSKDVSEDVHVRQTPFLYARYLSKQLRKFSSVLPHSRDRLSDSAFQSNGVLSHGFAPRTDAQTWISQANVAQDSAFHGIVPSTELNNQVIQDHRCSEELVADSQLYQLSEFPVNFSLVNFLQTVNEPQFAKSTPPPGEEEKTAQWWQHMYPVSSQAVPDACEWPMTMNDQTPLQPPASNSQRF